MNILIHMEIKTRELEARSLLGLIAAERGHRVLLGDVRPHLIARPQDFAPGIFHDKSLTPSAGKRRFFRMLADHGSLLTSQDEEHWLNLPDFDVPAVRRFSDETLALAQRSFAWGAHERDALHAAYPQHRDRIVATGSPRVDLWRPELRPYHTAEPLPGVAEGRPFVLFSSNFGLLLEVNRFWVRIRDKRQHYVGLDDHYEFDRYDIIADKTRVLREFVRGIRHLATTRPDLLVVVRPHPLETDGAWEDLIGPVPNVLVARERTLNAWVRQAVAVVQNGCTSGYEAAVAGTPVIALQPNGIFADLPVNALGLRASTAEELGAHVDTILAGAGTWAAHRGPGADELLHRRLAGLEGGLAADRIVDAWEALPDPDGGELDVDRVLRGRRIVALRRRAGAAKRRLTAPQLGRRGREDATVPERTFRTAHKFPPLEQSEVDRVVSGLATALGRFTSVEAQVIAPDLVRFRRRSR